MLQLKNPTGLAATMFLSPDPDGVDTLYAVVKGTFALDTGLDAAGEPPLAAEQVPIALAAEYHGDAASTSIRVPGDVGLVKPSTDVLLVGHAHAPHGRPATWADVSLAVGPVRKTVRVFGDRVWMRDGPRMAASAPVPFATMPLVWERAFGGADVVDGVPSAEVRNPVGTGYHADGGARPLDGLALPNLEDPVHPVASWTLGPPPACFAPIREHWQPRRAFAGTYDAAWQQRRAPYLPTDFDPRFLQLAPPDLIAPGYLTGGEPVEAYGVTPGGVLHFRLPRIDVTVTFTLDGAPQPRSAHLDTVLIEPDAGRVLLTWRAAFACDKKALRVREIAVAATRSLAPGELGGGR